ncbi:MAG: bifunctional precorrin-2 dehydrogenase/sirohydrochlorin ferrochelatase [Eudoraea sp.]|nr:bifunctional precorrin-2 dehydrogenase/sirohydrochlorin ferrochelatase [Eudoraea sp.]
MEKNTLYPVFLKPSVLKILIIGGGFVALEKLTFLTKSSPDAHITLLAPMIRPKTRDLLFKFGGNYIQDAYKKKHLEGFHIVIAATDDPDVNLGVYTDCRALDKLINVADNPPLCDFYMGGIVSKGQIKIGISTNGKSPTLAKRLRQFFEEVLPEDIDLLANNLKTYRDTLKGDFEAKVEKLNRATEELLRKS